MVLHNKSSLLEAVESKHPSSLSFDVFDLEAFRALN